MKGIPFIVGAWLPAIFSWWDNAQEFAIAATIIVGILMIAGKLDPI